MPVSNPIHILQDFQHGLVNLIFPPVCALCDTRLSTAESQLCQRCLSRLEPINHPHEKFSITGDIHIRTAWALFAFTPDLQSLIHQLKYQGRRKQILRILNYHRAYIQDTLTPAYDAIVPIPLHPLKLRERGYNQVDDMAKWVGQLKACPVQTSWVRRIRHTSTQTKLNAQERQTNMASAFEVYKTAGLEGAHILLVDDVLTTGATSNEVARILVQNGARQVDLLTLSTPPHGDA